MPASRRIGQLGSQETMRPPSASRLPREPLLHSHNKSNSAMPLQRALVLPEFAPKLGPSKQKFPMPGRVTVERLPFSSSKEEVRLVALGPRTMSVGSSSHPLGPPWPSPNVDLNSTRFPGTWAGLCFCPTQPLRAQARNKKGQSHKENSKS